MYIISCSIFLYKAAHCVYDEANLKQYENWRFKVSPAKMANSYISADGIDVTNVYIPKK